MKQNRFTISILAVALSACQSGQTSLVNNPPSEPEPIQIENIQSFYADSLQQAWSRNDSIKYLQAKLDSLYNVEYDSTKIKDIEGLIAQTENELYLLTENTDLDSMNVADDSELESLPFNAEHIQEIIHSMSDSSRQIPLEVNEWVLKHIQYYQTKGRDVFQRYLERAAIYFPVIYQELVKTEIPVEIIFLTMVESGVNPEAKSRAKAVGIWQFIRGTGRLYGLRGNFWFDDRKDVVKSTQAAAAHLLDLHDIFDDWYLALAAYNSGSGRVKRAIKRTGGTKDFWAIRRYIPRETRNYVPAYLAASILSANPEKFGFQLTPYHSGFQYDTLSVPGNILLDDIAYWADTSKSAIEFLNPALIQDRTPPDMASYTINIPPGTRALVNARLHEWVNQNSHQISIYHVVENGETEMHFLKKYGTPINDILKANPGFTLKTLLRDGNTLRIPVNEPAGYSMAYSDMAYYGIKSSYATMVNSDLDGYFKYVYRIKKGDTLGQIAQKFGVRISSIQQWNKLNGTTIRYGKSLVIYKKM